MLGRLGWNLRREGVRSVEEKILINSEWIGECLEWTGSRSKYGYGNVHLGGRCRRVTRVIMKRVLGRPLDHKEYVLHSCDNPPCILVEHLSIGDQHQNMADMRAKGRERKARGESNGNAVLTELLVREIRTRLASGEQGYSIDRDLGLFLGTASRIKHRRVWGWVA